MDFLRVHQCKAAFQDNLIGIGDYGMKSKIAGIVAVLLVFIFSSFSNPEAAQNAIKIGTISIQDVLAKSKAGEEAQKKLEAEFVTHQSKLKEEQEVLEAMKTEIEKKSSVWSDEVKDEKEREYQKKVREFGLKNEDAKFEMQQLEKKVMEPILKELHEVIAEVGKKQQLTLILENTMKGLRTKTGLLYADESLDISELVRKELDARMAK